MPRNVLLVTYYFPPSGGPGVQRALKLARYFPEFGWNPVVLTVQPESASYPDLDPSLGEELPASLRVERTPAWDPYALYARLMSKPKEQVVGVGFGGSDHLSWKERLARWVRANVFLPDARVGWVPYAVRRGMEVIQSTRIDAIITTGPPHSAHLVGRKLHRRTHLPWVADFRDPWVEIDFAGELPTTPLAARINASLERSVLREATMVTVVTPSWQRDLAARAPEARYRVILNGYDPADLPQEQPEPLEGFVITYVGNMNAARNPQALWDALRSLNVAARMPGLRLRLIGHIDPVVIESARQAGVAGLIEQVGYLPHGKAIQEMRRGTLLLLMINRADNQMGVVPGKIYEYMGVDRPVLNIGPPAGDAAAILKQAGAGETFSYDDASGVAAFLQRYYTAWAAGQPIAGAGAAAQAFSRRSQTGEMAQLLDSLVADQAATHHPRNS